MMITKNIRPGQGHIACSTGIIQEGTITLGDTVCSCRDVFQVDVARCNDSHSMPEHTIRSIDIDSPEVYLGINIYDRNAIVLNCGI